MRKVFWAVVAVVVPFVLYAVIVLQRWGEPYMRGDARFYYAAAVSLWADHDLALTNQLRGVFVRPSDLSVAKDGRLVLKHSVTMSIAALPLIVIFGPPGALAFNLLQLAAILLVVYGLALRVAAPPYAAMAVVVTATTGMLPQYVWNFSPDLFAALLLCAGLVALPKHDLAAGVLLGLAAVSKFALVLFLPGALFFSRRPWRLIAGAALPFVAFALYNQHFFGAPWITSYDRILAATPGRIVVQSQRADFTLPLLEGVRAQLADPDHGLLRTSAVTVLSFLALPFLAARNARLAIYFGASSMALFLFYAHYRLWNSSHYGNRFVMPVVILGALPLAAALAWLGEHLRIKPRFRILKR